MKSIIEEFLKMAEGKSELLSLQSLLSEEELFTYETMVKAMDSIDIMHVGRDLKKIIRTYKMTREQEIALMAYVKTLELMIKRARDTGAMDMMKDAISKPPTKDNSAEYSGSMFG